MSPEEERTLHWLRLKARIEAELESLAGVVEEAEKYAAAFRQKDPDLLALRGLGDVVHDREMAAASPWL